jgi:conjugative relaxase-like TrwC/TraI family protein
LFLTAADFDTLFQETIIQVPMIRMIQSTSASHAKSYFKEALMKSDYYLTDQELPGYVHGKIAERLGVKGQVTKDLFHSLCDNINPKTGKTLTQRYVEQRTVGYDINFHAPKSLSLIHALSKDDHVLDIFNQSVYETMLDIEADSKTRIRKDGKDEDRETGELVWANFIHQTARPVDGSAPDPHLHAHAFVFNVTWDETEQRFKAGQFRDIKRDMPYYQAMFHKLLSDKLIEKGYRIRQTQKSFEIEGVPQKAIDLFSKRTDEIGRAAKEKGITDVKELDKLGAHTRSKKQKGSTMAELKKQWRDQIKVAGLDKVENDNAVIRHEGKDDIQLIVAQDCVDHAIKHRFERASVMQDRRILETAYRYSIGYRNIGIDQITKAFKDDKRILHVPDRKMTVCTTKEVLSEEKRMVYLAHQGKGKFSPLYVKAPLIALKGEQYEAVHHVLTTPHRVSIIRGRAGAGKTTLMKEAVHLIEKTGIKVTVVAPSADASRNTLRGEGFEKADTVSRLLTDRQMQKDLKGGLLWVDEAGLLGTRDMTALLDLAIRMDARLVLGGDTRQHSSVIRGDALRILNTVGGIKSAEVSRIHRQKTKDYREAVQHISDGKIKEGFEKLDAMESIKTIDPLKPSEMLADDYLKTIKKGKSALVISPTHKHGDDVTAAIRSRLRLEKMIGKREVMITRLVNLNFTEAEKSDIRKYFPGDVIQFNQNMKGVKRGSAWSIIDVKNNRVHVQNDEGKSIDVSVDDAKNFDVFRKSEIALSKGDKIRITKNGFDSNDKRLDNGQMMEVVSVRKNGDIKVRNTVSKTNYSIRKDYGHIAHAHCITSHGSQGKTVDEVFIAQPAATFPATDMKQFYVSVSRGRNRVHIYTDDKKELLDHASQMRDRQSAIELVGGANAAERVAERLSREEMQKQSHPATKSRPMKKSSPNIARHYEPEI